MKAWRCIVQCAHDYADGVGIGHVWRVCNFSFATLLGALGEWWGALGECRAAPTPRTYLETPMTYLQSLHHFEFKFFGLDQDISTTRF